MAHYGVHMHAKGPTSDHPSQAHKLPLECTEKHAASPAGERHRVIIAVGETVSLVKRFWGIMAHKDK
eukprot:CAMPEP_0181335204 /NCGR_PEP_ID=MMETSP1101-20121128/26701_1 /TAXON_ID=46948 /ORGANISM="Rhodomonas abbreviata, Strain Caron Lab Isolate" /LENGTH=66 /DNA_ID=CAMNT_0023445297 /DNA_START=149 /DNA_END=345 /DNA_ORIENTATION=+